MQKYILKVKVDSMELAEAKERVIAFLSQPLQYKIFTPNPEMLVKAQKDDYFRDVLNTGDLNICDGFGLWLASRLSSQAKSRDPSTEPVPSVVEGIGMTGARIPGADFMLDICQMAAENNKSIYLLGSGKITVVQKTAEELKRRYPKLNIVGFSPGPKVAEDKQNKLEINNLENYNAVAEINGAEPDIVFVAFGMGKQEKWIAENLQKMLSVKIAMGVGGSFDFISGCVRRAPCWMRKIGLEWLYRLIQEPKRFFRIFNATIKFTFLMIKEKIL